MRMVWLMGGLGVCRRWSVYGLRMVGCGVRAA